MLSLERGTAKKLLWKSNFKQISFQFVLRKVSIVSTDLIVIGFQIVGATTEKARLPVFSLVLGKKRCLETDELRNFGPPC